MPAQSTRHIQPLLPGIVVVDLTPADVHVEAEILIASAPPIVLFVPAYVVVEAVAVAPSNPPTVDLAAAAAAIEAVALDASHELLLPVDLLWVYDLLDTQTMAIDQLFALELDDRHQDSELLRFTIAADDPKAGYVLIDGLARYRRRLYRITRRDPKRDGTRAVIEVEAEARWAELAGILRVGSFLAVDVDITDGLTAILGTTPWTVGVDTIATDPIYAIDKTDASTLELLRLWAAITNTELIFDTWERTVTAVAQQGETRPTGFRYGWNLQDITRREIPPGVTRLYAYGRNNLTIEGPNPSGDPFIEDFTYYTDQGLTEPEARERYTRDQVWVDSSFVSDVPLYDAAVARLAGLARPTIAYEAKVISITEALDTPLELGLGDTVLVYDGPLDISVHARVVRIVHRPLAPHTDQIELAYLQGRVVPDSSSLTRGTDIEEWLLFLENSASARTIRETIAILADIGLQYASGGEAIYHVDIVGTATGTGTLRTYLYDEVDDVVVGPTIEQTFVAGPVHVSAAFSRNDLQGNYLFSLRTVVSSGTGTIAVTSGEARFSILTKGGLGVTIPPGTHSETFTHPANGGADGIDGGPHLFEVPDGVTELVLDCYGAFGGYAFGAGPKHPGRGGRMRARVPVTSGETLQIFPGGWPNTAGAARQLGGDNGGGGGGDYSADGGGGGGATDVRRSPYGLADRLVVAGGGGGEGVFSSGGVGGTGTGGDGAYPTGGAGSGVHPGGGGTSSAGGAGGSGGGGGDAGAPGTLGGGGDAFPTGGAGAGGGGGGGGLYGGGGAGSDYSSNVAGGGGGSSGAPAAGATELLSEDGVNEGHGYAIVSWDDPV